MSFVKVWRVVGLVKDEDDREYRKLIEDIVDWCHWNLQEKHGCILKGRTEQALPAEENKVFWSAGITPEDVLLICVSAIFYGVVFWSSSLSTADRKRLDKLVKKAISILGIPLDSHLIYDTVTAQSISFSDKLIKPKCVKERYRRSFLPAAVSFYNLGCSQWRLKTDHSAT